MLIVFLCAAIWWPAFQANSSTFYVHRTEALTKYDSRYIHDLAYLILPPDELRSSSDVECLVSELKGSGIFQDVQAELLKTDEENVRILKLDTVYQPALGNFVVSAITLNNFADVDPAHFRAALDKKGVKSGIPYLRYSYSDLQQKVEAALLEVLPKTPGPDDTLLFWISIRASGPRDVKLIVSPRYSGCNVKVKE